DRREALAPALRGRRRLLRRGAAPSPPRGGCLLGGGSRGELGPGSRCLFPPIFEAPPRVGVPGRAYGGRAAGGERGRPPGGRRATRKSATGLGGGCSSRCCSMSSVFCSSCTCEVSATT